MTDALRPEFVEFIPSHLEEGVIYISTEYETAVHLCCSGCGEKVVTPLTPTGWRLTSKNGTVTLYPSIGNWSFACQSHYWIRNNRIEWARGMTQAQIEAGRRQEWIEQQAYFDKQPVQAVEDETEPRIGFWRRASAWLSRVVQR